ncbi:hypothetical protein CSW18_04625 [Thermus scotoductus]|uniref:HTH cro/C1-type domain-containing protein n=1 Tax=Thermus scotoductus TaxID=37636 RepID=A0A430RZJ6_THESC|nr:hypothetical protein CSW40_04615 [Thermus scotoductus]RTI40698.1 hypothetical protein CSW18_04625 [Thermus scotoductus]
MEPRIRLKLREILDQEGVSAYALSRTIAQKVSPNTVYALTRGTTQRPDLQALAWVVWGLRRLTGKPYEICDLLKYEEGYP